MKNKVILSLGSNLGDRESNLLKVIKYLNNYNILNELKISNIYETPPFGVGNQPDYLNICISGYTNQSALTLISLLKNLEIEIGRVDRGKWKEREIDIDILFYEDLVLNNDKLILPHPRLQDRRFVLMPATEIEENFIHPIFEKSLKKLLEECKDDSVLKRFIN